MSDFTDEQKELMKRPVITIMPSFNDEWVIEVHNYEDELQGRFNAENVDVLLSAIRAALTDTDSPHNFGVN